MKKTLNELSHDLIAQRSCLRLESAPKVSDVASEGEGESLISAEFNKIIFWASLNRGFALGYGDINSGDRNNRSKNLHRSNSSWSRRSQSKRRASQSGYGGDQNDREDGAEKVWVQCRLDRAFGNAKWFRLFPQSHTAYLEKTAPDHTPIFTSLANSGQRRTGRFMFDKRWCKKPEVTEVIRRGWCSNFAFGQGSVSERIKACRQELYDYPRRPINKERELDVNLRVSSLFGTNGQCDVIELQQLFPENEVTRILHMQVGNVPDRDIWAYSPHGSYTVKSVYALAMKFKEAEAVRDMSDSLGVLELKRLIWKVPTIPKIHRFLWRAASGVLAVAKRINTRGLELDTCCRICKSAGESIEHVLFNCTMA
ncbi:hypothetical protein F2Q69_00022006 [Brassica cretica]|uniref:Reverse transcriptase zinc-binding domain-containing protein n=1 Tax=Brassica cretica TaxID=69181 RepID=A0A8S9QEH9_BRACR|nr:hypothetical protein F2Q69_00022006 [Brassica cretica]